MGTEKLWTTEELAEFLGVHPRTVINHVESGRLKGHRIGKYWRFRQADVDAFLASTAYTAPSAEETREEEK